MWTALPVDPPQRVGDDPPRPAPPVVRPGRGDHDEVHVPREGAPRGRLEDVRTDQQADAARGRPHHRGRPPRAPDTRLRRGRVPLPIDGPRAVRRRGAQAAPGGPPLLSQKAGDDRHPMRRRLCGGKPTRHVRCIASNLPIPREIGLGQHNDTCTTARRVRHMFRGHTLPLGGMPAPSGQLECRRDHHPRSFLLPIVGDVT